MAEDPADTVSVWLCGYATKKIASSFLTVFGRKIKRSQEGGTIDDEISSALNGMKMSENAEMAFSSERNRRLVSACILFKDTGAAKHMDPADMENVTSPDDEIRNEIREFILTVHERLWSQPGTEGAIGSSEIQNSIKADLIDVVRELRSLRDVSVSEDDDENIISAGYPRPVHTFTGRESELMQLSIMIEKNDTLFVCGPDGIGKTETVRKFAEGWASLDHDNREGKRTVVWLSYEGCLRSTIAWHLKVKGISENETTDEEKLFKMKLSILDEDPSALVVIDNFDPKDDHLNIIDQYRFRKIMISTDKECLKRYNGIELKCLPENKAMEMFINSLNSKGEQLMNKEEDKVRKMLRSADHHTLTISLIADNVNAYGTGPEKIIKMLSDTKNNSERIFKLLYDSAEGKEKEILKAISLLPASGMRLKKFIEFSELAGDDDRDALRSLEIKGWVNITHIEDTNEWMISVHPCIMKIIKKEFVPKEDECYAFFGSLERFFDLGRAYNNWDEKMDMLPVLVSAADASSKSPYASIMYSLAGRYLRGSGDHDISLRYYFKALKDKENKFGTEHPSIAPTYTGIGNVYSDKGEYDKAVEYYIKALKVSGRMSGINDPSIATTYNNVGIAYSEKGEYDKALQYYKKALDIRERVLGNEHQDTAMTYNQMGNAHSDKGEYGKALECYEKALKIREKVFGVDNYYTAATCSNMSVLYLRTGRYDKARDSAVKAMEILRRTVGADHPDTVTAYEVISYINKLTGDEDTYEEYKSQPVTEDWNFMYR
ncbi:MAG: tetratricopeptide repeat protein [Methanomassiliicoccaceae archaeon]|nr:tetratricopeptide repeat protein [Methanomassiliicoccaceae archaeon]